MSNEQDITNDQLNPADFDKSIPEIAPTLPETDEISPKLASADAIVNEFLEQCRADIEKNAKNAEKIAENNGNLQNNAGIYGKAQNNTENNRNLRNNVNPMEKITENCGKKQSGILGWIFSGEQIRIILRRSLVKNYELAKAVGISKDKLVYLLRSEIFPMEITKVLAQKIGLNTPEELQEYYDTIPKEVKENVQFDARIYRPLKPGIVIPSEIFKAAEKIGKLSEVIEAARVSQGR